MSGRLAARPVLTRALTCALALASACATTTGKPHVASPAWQQSLHDAEAAERRRAHDAADASYQLASEQADTDDARATVSRAWADTLISWRQLTRAAQQLRILVQVAPTRADGWNDLGIVAHQLALVDESERAFQHAIELAPKDTRPRLALAAMYWATRQKPRALAQYRELATMPLPAAVAQKVTWAIQTLSAELSSGGAPPSPAANK